MAAFSLEEARGSVQVCLAVFCSVSLDKHVLLTGFLRCFSGSQPFFLALVLVGCLVSTATILAMAREDEGDGPVDSCVAIPWFYSLGFSITFGTLFAKIRRVYGIFSREHQMSPISSTRRAVLSFRDTLATICKVLVLDVVILTLWTAIEPLHWERTVIREDQFGFPLESQGYCTSDRWELFLGVIIVLHVALCATACYMCYMARNIPSRYSEHKYLTIAMVSNLQVFAIGGTFDCDGRLLDHGSEPFSHSCFSCMVSSCVDNCRR